MSGGNQTKRAEGSKLKNMYVLVEWREAKESSGEKKSFKAKESKLLQQRKPTNTVDQEKQTNRAYISQIVKWREAKN